MPHNPSLYGKSHGSCSHLPRTSSKTSADLRRAGDLHSDRRRPNPPATMMHPATA
eukprot:CAMPEP_0181371748 /NCGR_PEP_ID=MMETSP1106-20121128/14292_1 /TAXON_ID=81844 /ORGANISM="Mantoniella antarctica, Strain SL-175" /LENGTH=54 /DNA_ID=CAMNT_0023488963 /DNA_START=73 /DNA_END=234 /DNA_ORIENTATION=-